MPSASFLVEGFSISFFKLVRGLRRSLRARNFLLFPVALGLFVPHAYSQTRTANAGCAPVRFSGEVTRDQKYTHALPGNLEFRLLPSPEGWSISMGRPGERNEDFVGIAGPYHGMIPSIIEAWHFRNADNTGPNKGEVNAPDETRDFSFVMNEAQYKTFSHALDLWSGATEKERNDGAKMLLNAPRRKGTLHIVDMELGGLENGTHPWFESMKFNVDLCYPPPAAPPPAKDSTGKAPSAKKTP
jgi:hypothetical protein